MLALVSVAGFGFWVWSVRDFPCQGWEKCHRPVLVLSRQETNMLCCLHLSNEQVHQPTCRVEVLQDCPFSVLAKLLQPLQNDQTAKYSCAAVKGTWGENRRPQTLEGKNKWFCSQYICILVVVLPKQPYHIVIDYVLIVNSCEYTSLSFPWSQAELRNE